MASPKAPRRTFADFQQQLQPLDNVKARLKATQDLHQHLSASSPGEVLAFGQELAHAIRAHEESDSLAQAHHEGRAIFRSWHSAGAVDQVEAASHSGDAAAKPVSVYPRLGFDAFNVLLDPAAFRAHKDAYKAGTSRAGPTIETPSTLLQAREKTPSVFADTHGTVTALLPEEHYAAFFAFNEVAKDMRRQQKAGSSASGDAAEKPPGRHEVEALAAHAKSLRASVTRPVFFAFEDIGSYTHAIADPNPQKSPHIRKGHGLTTEDPKLHTGFHEKMADPLRVNAVFYQSFNKSVPDQRKTKQSEWNEMVVKFRATGHTAALSSGMDKMVPAMQGREKLNISPVATVGNPDRSSTKVIEPIMVPTRKK